MINSREVNFDGLVGPTHNYGGLSYGNVASEKNQFAVSNPKEAALQGLEKMKFLADLGIKQAILPPHERPFFPILRQLGFTGDEKTILKKVYKYSQELLVAIHSAAAMWTANAATISPSNDSFDRHVHFTPANLSSKFHRSLEAETTSNILKTIFNDPLHFVHHDPLPSGIFFADEGAANHTRFCLSHSTRGIQLFVFGRYAFQPNSYLPAKYPARQTQEASLAVARRHRLLDTQIILAQQNPEAIDAGAFHNDVVSVGNENVFFFHENAFINQQSLIEEIENKFSTQCNAQMILLEVKSKDISLDEAVTSYLFNSQLISLPNGKMALIAPIECQENPKIKAYLDHLIASNANPIQEVHYLDLRQSMRNGGGPACLRLRVALTDKEIHAAHQQVFLNKALYEKLKVWIHQHYRDRLHLEDLADPQLLNESYNALQDLSTILHLGNIYPFQQ